MRAKLLAAAASLAFVAAGAAYAQDNPRHEGQGGGAMHAQPQGAAEPRAAQGETRQENSDRNPGRAAQGETRQENSDRNPGRAAQGETRTQNGPAEKRDAQSEPRREQPRAAESNPSNPSNAAAPEKRGAQAEPRNGERHDNAANGGKTQQPAAAERRDTNGAERRENANNTPNHENAGAGERRENAGAEKRDPNRAAETNGARAPGERTGANETGRNGEHNGPVRVSGNVRVSNDHAERISRTLLHEARPVREHIDVRVGERVPERIVLQPLPADVVEIVPEYRGYDYFVEDDEIVFVSPSSHEIVGSIGYEGRAAANDVTHVRSARPCPTED